MRVLLGLVCAVAAALSGAGLARAAAQPDYGPPPAWVDVAAVPQAPPADGAAAVQVVLDDNQTRLSPDGDAYYDRRIYKVLKPEGLIAFKTQTFTWDPTNEVLTIHALNLLRDGQVIDLLKGGAGMQVMQRETNLERAMLDGRLTVSRQIDGLQTGDMVELSFTRVRRDPVVQGRSQDFEKMAFPGVAARYRVRLSWPDAQPVKWKVTSGFLPPTATKADGWNLVSFDGTSVTAPIPPAGAPLRYRRQAELEVSSFKDWAEVSRLMQPLYAKAMTLGQGSAVKAEADKIRAANPDARSRAFAALRLVEEKTRYLFLGMNDGGYVPAPAEVTWSRKFGDCKGKTVLLLALLKELGITAEPALVSMGLGDGLDERLPGLTMFNHVLVRATVGGKTYWLDGTRMGDVGGLDSVSAPPWRWALPLRPAGAGLEAIPIEAPSRPMVETYIRLDASKGLDVPAPVRIEFRLTGDTATIMRRTLASAPRADLERGARETMSRTYSWMDITGITWEDDPAHNTFKTVFTGQADIDWRKNPDLNVREFKLPTGGAPTAPFARREPGPDHDAPYVVVFPYYVRSITEMVLPAEGQGFQVRGPNDSESVGGYEVRRSTTLEGGVARFVSEGRSMVTEVPAKDAEAANRTVRRLAADESFVRAPS